MIRVYDILLSRYREVAAVGIRAIHFQHLQTTTGMS
jgi:hypothetical protein